MHFYKPQRVSKVVPYFEICRVVEKWLIRLNSSFSYLSLGVSRREDAKECFADECVESLCASRRSRRYSRSPVTLKGVGVIRAANGGSGTSSTHDSAQLKEKSVILCFVLVCPTIPTTFSGGSRVAAITHNAGSNNLLFSYTSNALKFTSLKIREKINNS